MTRDASCGTRPLLGLPAQLWAPGVQWAVGGVRRDRAVLAGGLADVLRGSGVTSDTVFLSSSTTKVLTAILVLQASDRGELSLDGVLADYLPDVPYRAPITLRMLLSHRSGLPDPNPMSWVHAPSGNSSFDEDRVLAEVMRLNPRLKTTPGQRYRYSNLGYWLLGRVLERATGKNFGNLLAERIVKPLGLDPLDLGCAVPPNEVAALGHVRRFGTVHAFLRLFFPDCLAHTAAHGWARLDVLQMNGPAYGGVFARAAGYLAVAQDLFSATPVLLRPATRDALLDPTVRSPGTVNEFGLRVGSFRGGRYLSKPGGGPGFCSNLRIYPDQKLASVWLANALSFSERRIEHLSDRLDEALFPECQSPS